MEDELPHLLIVDDDARRRELLRKFLSEKGFRVSTASDAQDAHAKLTVLEFDLIVLDLMMPGQTGLEFSASLREAAVNFIPILMLTAMSEPQDRIAGLESGADDYLTKPFEPRELLLRINNILRRRPERLETPANVRLGDVVFNPAQGLLEGGGKAIRLTEVERCLLAVLAERPGTVFSRQRLVELTGARGGNRAVDIQVTRLRRKIEQDPRMPRYLQTVRGRGYLLKPS